MAYETLSDKSYAFAIRVVRLHQHLREAHQSYGVGDQMLRSGTSIGANVSETVFSQSIADNVVKFSIALKEANESRYWLRLLGDTDTITAEQCHSMVADCEELIGLLVKTIKTLKSKQ